MAISSKGDRMVAGMEQAEADANIQYAISLLHPFLVKLLLSNPITKKKLGNQKKDFSQSLQAIIEDWELFYPTEYKFTAFQKYFSRAKQVRHLVAHQSFDRNRYQHYMESLANVATAVGQPNLNEIILNQVLVKDIQKENQEEKNQVNNATTKKEEWLLLKEEGNQLHKEESWNKAMDCYTRAIHLNQQDAVLFSNRALCELRLSKFDLAREDIEDAIQLDPKNVKYFRVLSEVLLEMRMHQESLTVCLQGLKINPRDEVLNLRERDCRALIVSDLIDKGPTVKFGANEEEKREKFKKIFARYKNLNLTSEDIEEERHTLDKSVKHSQFAKSFIEAAQLMSSPTTKTTDRKVVEILKAAAKKGSTAGLYALAMLYNEGKCGLPRDFYKAIELCRKAASRKAFVRSKESITANVGVAEAECFLGDCYRDGRGVDRNTAEAFKWYLKAASHDCLFAQSNLGYALLNGDGCKKNETSARSWFQKANEHVYGVAQYQYAIMLEEGIGGPVDTIKAAEILQLCADQGTPGALVRLQKLSMSGALGGTSMEKTKENLQITAKKGDPASLFLLGQNYFYGTGGFEKDLHQAEIHLREASKKGHEDANLTLGKLLLEIKKNEDAFQFIKLAAEKGCAGSQFELGTLFAYGVGCARDEAKARRWFNRAKQQGFLLEVEGSFIEDWVEKEIDCGREIFEFETQQQLKTEGMSVEEREKRFISSKLKNNDPVTSTLEYLRSVSPNAPASLTLNVQSKAKNITPECLEELLSRAANGSTTAKSFFKAIDMMVLASDHLERQQTSEAFKLLRLSLRKWDLLNTQFSGFYADCVEAAMKALDRNSKDAEAVYVLARLDMAKSMEETLQLAKRCVELDPTVPDYHHYFASLVCFFNDFKNGLRAIDRALELLPKQLGWQFERASLLRMKEEEEKKKCSVDAEEAYLKFVSSNPMDHRNFPEACYYLAQYYLLSHDESKGKMYYQKALDAEDPQIRLPFFEPIDDDHPVKVNTRMLLKGLEKRGDLTLEKKEMTNNCANCFKSNQFFRCTACKSVWYCDRACQVAHWKKHKVDCKRVIRL